jgi:hypothetical protein
MVDSGLGLTIAFNGCIYNYPELRAELESKGYSFSPRRRAASASLPSCRRCWRPATSTRRSIASRCTTT